VITGIIVAGLANPDYLVEIEAIGFLVIEEFNQEIGINKNFFHTYKFSRISANHFGRYPGF
jgi:hypothetical protein